MQRVSCDIVVETDRISSKSESAPEYFGISNIENPVFDTRAMDTDRPSQEGREDVPSELSFSVSAPEADPMPVVVVVVEMNIIVVTHSSEGTHPEPTSAMVTRSRAREGRGISVAPEVPIEPEIEMRPEPEITTCEKGLGASRSYPTNTASLFTFGDKPKTLTIPTSQEVTETNLLTAVQSQSDPNLSISK